METHTYICSHCKRELPAEAFYFNSKKQTYDSYCRECRNECSRLYRKGIKGQRRPYPIITEIPNKEKRIWLILHAKETVRKSVDRKRILMIEREAEQDFI